jgi:hypothetical protein
VIGVRGLSITLPMLADDDVIELDIYISCATSQMGEPESKKIREFFDFVRQKRREIEEERWRKDPQNLGACCKWPYEDELPF